MANQYSVTPIEVHHMEFMLNSCMSRKPMDFLFLLNTKCSHFGYQSSFGTVSQQGVVVFGLKKGLND